MAGIMANSATETMVAGDTSVDKAVSGYLTRETIALTLTGSPTSARWSLAKPTTSGSITRLSETDELSTSFSPDVEGYYTVTCVIDDTTSYVLRVAVAQIAAVSTLTTVRLMPLADAQVPAPATGQTLFFSSDVESLVAKDSTGTVTSLGTSGSGTGDVNGPASATVGRIATFADTTGKLIGDSGSSVSSILASADTAAAARDVTVLSSADSAAAARDVTVLVDADTAAAARDAALSATFPTAGGAPANVTKAAAAAGVASTYSRSDHKHDITTAAPGAFSVTGVAADEGTATTLARSDHAHSITGQLPYANFTNGTACSIAGRSANTTGVQASISLGTNGFVALRRSDNIVGGLVLDENIDSSAAIAHNKLANIATDKLLGRDTAATGALEAIGVGHGVEFDGSGNLRVSATLPARGTENVAVDLLPSTQSQGTLATAASVNFDVAIATGKRYAISADVWVDDGTGSGACLFAKALYTVAHQTGGIAVKVVEQTIHDNLGAGFLFTSAVSTTNIRYTLANSSGTTRSYNVVIGAVVLDKP
jgi:hypothetical protein